MLAETAVSGLLSGDLKEATVSMEPPKMWVSSDDSQEDYGYMSIGGILFTSTYLRIGLELAKLCAQNDKVILTINSPGGVATGMLDLADKIYELRKKAEIYAIVSEGAYSAAYGIASAASKIFLARGAGVGSVGVISTHVNQSKFDENLGVEITAIIAGDKKNDYSPHCPLSERAHADVQKHVDSIYNDFCRTVAWNRGISIDAVKETQAGIFHEQDAVNIGFVDEVASFEKAVQKIFHQGTANQYAKFPTLASKATAQKPTASTPAVNPLVEDAKKRAAVAGISTPTANTSVNSETDNPTIRAFEAIAAKRANKQAGASEPTVTPSTNPVIQAFSSLAANAERRAEAYEKEQEALKKEEAERDKISRLAASLADRAPSYLH